MSIILDNESFLGSKSELDFFSVPPTQVAIEKGSWFEVYPKNTVTNHGPYEFEITPDPFYLDLNKNYLYMVLSITKTDGTAIAKDSDVAFINCIGKTFFKQCKVWLNSTLAYDSSDTYAYRAYLETLLNYGSDAKATHLQSGLFFYDTGNKMDSPANPGHTARLKFSEESKHVELMCPIHCDIFNQDRFMLNNMNVRLELHRNSDSFAINSFGGDPGVRINVINMMWYVRKVDVLKSLAVSLESQLSKHPAKYPIRRVAVKTLHISGSRKDTPQNVIFSGQIPRRVLVGLLDKAAFHGAVDKNPFNFKNFGIRQICVTAGGINYPRNPLPLDFDKDMYMRSFMSLFEALNMTGEDKGNEISYKAFKNGYTIFAFDLSADNCADSGYWQLIQDGTTSIKIEFAKDTPPDGLRCIILGEFDNLMTIDKYRNVHFDYSL